MRFEVTRKMLFEVTFRFVRRFANVTDEIFAFVTATPLLMKVQLSSHREYLSASLANETFACLRVIADYVLGECRFVCCEFTAKLTTENVDRTKMLVFCIN